MSSQILRRFWVLAFGVASVVGLAIAKDAMAKQPVPVRLAVQTTSDVPIRTADYTSADREKTQVEQVWWGYRGWYGRPYYYGAYYPGFYGGYAPYTSYYYPAPYTAFYSPAPYYAYPPVYTYGFAPRPVYRPYVGFYW